MRQLNWKFLLVLVLGVCVLSIGAVSLWAFRSRNSDAIIKRKAEEAQANGDLKGAIKFYGEYLIKNPKEYEIQAKRALLASELAQKDDARLKDRQTAGRLLEEALREDALRERVDLRRELIDVQMRTPGMMNEALNNIDKLTDPKKPDPELDFLYVQGAFVLKAYDKAAPRLERLVGYDPQTRKFDVTRATAPNNVEAYWHMALLLREHRTQYEEAEAAVNAMVNENPKSAKALISRSNFKMYYASDKNVKANKERLESAKVDLRKALELDPKNVDALIENSELASRDDDYATAVQFLERSLAISPKNEGIYRLLAKALYKQGKPKDAITKIEQALEELPNNQELMWALYQLHFQQLDSAGCQKTIDRMEKARMMPERIKLAKARLPMLEQKWSESAKKLEEIRPQMAIYAPLALMTDLALTDCYQRLRQPDMQLKTCTRILETDAKNVDALRGKALALTMLMRHPEALEVYQKDLRLAMGNDFMRDPVVMGGYHTVLVAMARIDPPNAKHFEELAERIRKVLKAENTNPTDITILKVDGLLREKKGDEAVAVATKAIAENPKDIRLRIALVAAIAVKQGIGPALVQLSEVERELGVTGQTHIFRAELLMKKGGPELKQRLAELEKSIAAVPAEERAEMWSRLGRNYYRLGPASREDVLRCWRQALELRPGDGSLLEGIFELGREAGDNQAMLQTLDEIEKALGRNSSLWRYAEASRLVAQVRERNIQTNTVNIDKASKLLDQVAAQRPDWHMLLRLQGEIADLKQDQEAAIAFYAKSLEQGPPNAAIVQRLVELQLSRQQYQEARKTLQRLGDTSQMRGWLPIMAEIFGGGNPAVALKSLDREVPELSKSPADLLRKGQLLLTLSQAKDADAALRKEALDKAEAALRRATEVGPNVPQTWLALVEFLTKFRSGAAAERVIRDAENQLSEDQAAIVLAQSYALLGAYEQAEHYYLMALNNGPRTPGLARTIANFYLTSKQARKAEPILRSLVSESAKFRSEDQQHAVWARRELAQLWAPTPSYPQFQAAVKLVEENIASSAGSPGDALLLGRLYAARGDVRSLRQAEQILEKYKESPAFSFEDRLALANVCFATNQGERGRRLLEDLSADQRDDVRVLTMMADTLLKSKETESAQTFVRRLESQQPDAPSTWRLGALLAMGRDRPDDAEKLVIAKLPKEVKPDNAGKFVQAAMILESVKHYKGAEKLLRSTAAAAPKTRLDLAAFLARRGRAAECLALIQEQWSDDTIDVACILGTQALREQKGVSGQIDPAQSKLVLSWYEQARKRPQRSFDARLHEAVLLDTLDRSEEAEQTYHTILATTGIPDFLRGRAANNLAFLLAIQGRNLADAQQLVDFAVVQSGPAKEQLDTQAMVAWAKGNIPEAVKVLKDITEFQGTSEMFFHLALACQKADDSGGAVRALVRAREEGLNDKALSRAEQKLLTDLENWLGSKAPARS